MRRRAGRICCILAFCLISGCILTNTSFAYDGSAAWATVQSVKPAAKTAPKSAPKSAAKQAGEQPEIYFAYKEPENEEELWFREKLPMKKEHQKVLWDYCQIRKLDYIDMLALIYTESNFNEKCSTGSNKGYFQIGKVHFAGLAKTLNTSNNPLDGKININWGTAMYSWILEDQRVKKLTGKKQRDVALSIFQRGTGGYDKYGISYNFLETYDKKREIVSSYFEK